MTGWEFYHSGMCRSLLKSLLQPRWLEFSHTQFEIVCLLDVSSLVHVSNGHNNPVCFLTASRMIPRVRSSEEEAIKYVYRYGRTWTGSYLEDSFRSRLNRDTLDNLNFPHKIYPEEEAHEFYTIKATSNLILHTLGSYIQCDSPR